MSDLAQKIQILVRIEKIRLRLAGRAIIAQLFMLLLASILALGGLVMFSLAAYLVVSSYYGPLIGALAVGGGFFVLAALLLIFARRFGHSAHDKTVDELEKLVLAEIKSDLGQGQLPLKFIETGAAALMKNSGSLPYVLTALFAFLSRLLKTRK